VRMERLFFEKEMKVGGGGASGGSVGKPKLKMGRY
jgi:hypothetical protein